MSAPPRPLPAAADLTYGQAKGWNCALCGKRLTDDAISMGRIPEESIDLDFEVWACAGCGKGGSS